MPGEVEGAPIPVPPSGLGTDLSCLQMPTRAALLNGEALGFSLYPLLGEAV